LENKKTRNPKQTISVTCTKLGMNFFNRKERFSLLRDLKSNSNDQDNNIIREKFITLHYEILTPIGSLL
jgi:hypothetical protein